MAWAGVAVLCAVAALAQDAGAAGGQSQTQPSAQPGPRSDGQIEMDVVHALDASAALPERSDYGGDSRVRLRSPEQYLRHMNNWRSSIAAHVECVTKVHDDLQIGDPGSDAQALQPGPGSQDVPDAGGLGGEPQQGTAGVPSSGTGSGPGSNPTRDGGPRHRPPRPTRGQEAPPPPAAADGHSPEPLISPSPPGCPAAPAWSARPVVL